MTFALDTIDNMVEYIKTQANDPSGVFFDDTEIKQWWFEGVMEYAQELDYFIETNSSTVATVASTGEYTLPTDLVGIVSVYVTVNSNDQIVDPTSRKRLDLELPAWKESSGEPTEYYFEENTIGFSPIPDAVYTITIVYVKSPAQHASDPLVPVWHRKVLTHYVLSQAYYKQHDERRSDTELNKFYLLLARAKHNVKKKRDRLPVITNSRFTARITPRR